MRHAPGLGNKVFAQKPNGDKCTNEAIYQATFSRDNWRGRADFLIRRDAPSDRGDWRRHRCLSCLDLLDQEVARPHRVAGGAQRESRTAALRARRDLLKGDLVAVDRSTEQDWATLRTKVERDLEAGEPGAQLAPRSDSVSGEAQ